MLNYKRPDKARKVASFIIDFDKVSNQVKNVLKDEGYFVLVVGNRRVHNHLVLFDQIIKELFEERFLLVNDFNRQIW